MLRTTAQSQKTRTLWGGAMSEYLPILAIVLSLGMQLAWRNFGDEIRLHGGKISQELAGSPAGAKTGAASDASHSDQDWGQGGSGAASGPAGSGSGNENANSNGQEQGSSASAGGGGRSDNANYGPGTTNTNTASGNAAGSDAGSNSQGSGASLNSGAQQNGSTSANGDTASNSTVVSDPSVLEQAGAFADGLWEGFRTQFWGIVELVLHPIDSAKAFYTLGEALYRDFDSTIAVIKDELGKDLEALTSGDPRETGRILGENLSPASLARLASKLSSIAKATRKLDLGCSSFSQNTLVWTDQGKVPIQDIEKGTRVLARSEQGFADSYRTVSQTMQREANETLLLDTGYDQISVTPEHPFWLQGRGWTAAKHLESGNAIATAEGDILIRRITKHTGTVTVYNFSVANDPNYFVAANGLWVHNSDNVVCDLAARDKKKPSAAKARKQLNTHRPGRRRLAEELNLYYQALGKAPPYMPGTEVIDKILRRGQKIYIIEYAGQKNPGVFSSKKIYTSLEEARRDLALPENWKYNDGRAGGLVVREYTVIKDMKVRDSIVGPQGKYPGGGQQYDVAYSERLWSKGRWKKFLDRDSNTKGIVHTFPR